MNRIILINGKARVGKDTLASFLVKELKHRGFKNVYVRGNAQTVKDYAKQYFQWNGEKDDQGRKLLINITNMMYDLQSNYWETKTNEFFWDRVVKNRGEVILIVPDWRYINTLNYFEGVAKSCKNVSLHTIHLEREGFKNNLSQELKDDISENNGLEALCDIRIKKQSSDLHSFVDIARLTVNQILNKSE